MKLIQEITSWLKALLDTLLKLIPEKHVIEIDLTVINPCQAKVVRTWSWRRLKYRTYVVHVSRDGKLT